MWQVAEGTEWDFLLDTVEVNGSSPFGPTIFFSELASATLLGKAPNGSIKELVRDSQGSIRLWAQDR